MKIWVETKDAIIHNFCYSGAPKFYYYMCVLFGEACESLVDLFLVLKATSPLKRINFTAEQEAPL